MSAMSDRYGQPAHPAQSRSALDAAIARNDLEVVALRLALGVLATLEEWRSGAAATREDVLGLLTELAEGQDMQGRSR